MAARMSAYYVIAIVIAVGAVVLSAIGLSREDFPPSSGATRALIGGAAVLVIAGVVALLATTHVEHPREEAAKAAAEKKAEKAPSPGAAKGESAKTVKVEEGEFFVKLQDGKQLAPAKYRFNAVNTGKIQHDLAIEGKGLPKEPKTPLIDPGKSAPLNVDLKPGNYKLYCTVPGHEQSGMRSNVTVR
jgi:uncharacterized cupredoxin-like copper-binding protein